MTVEAIAMSSTSATVIQCREKQLPHYFGRLVHALDIFKHAENEGQWNQVRLWPSKATKQTGQAELRESKLD